MASVVSMVTDSVASHSKVSDSGLSQTLPWDSEASGTIVLDSFASDSKMASDSGLSQAADCKVSDTVICQSLASDTKVSDRPTVVSKSSMASASVASDSIPIASTSNSSTTLHSSSDKRSVGTQAGMFDTRSAAAQIQELLDKCSEIHKYFKNCQEAVQEGHGVVDQTEEAVCHMQTTLDMFCETMDSLGSELVDQRWSLLDINQQVEKKRKIIAAKKEMLLAKRSGTPCKQTAFAGRILELREERQKAEVHLNKVNNDIDTKYEEMFEAREKLSKMKETRIEAEEEHSRHLEELHEVTENVHESKQNILSYKDGPSSLAHLYVSPRDLRRLKMEIEDLKEQQIQVDRHISMQMEERHFLRKSTAEVLERVQNMEKKVRKETGDHKLRSSLTTEPNWYPDLSGPSIWTTGPPLTYKQMEWLRDQQTKKRGSYEHAHASSPHYTQMKPAASSGVAASKGRRIDDLLRLDIDKPETKGTAITSTSSQL